MKEYPFVSVVVVSYNSNKHIKECLDSLLDLDYPKNRYEILVVDGGSNDGTVNVVKEYKKIII